MGNYGIAGGLMDKGCIGIFLKDSKIESFLPGIHLYVETISPHKFGFSNLMYSSEIQVDRETIEPRCLNQRCQ